MSKDFSENLRGKSFQGTNLTNYNFDGADIRGANFKNCNGIGNTNRYVALKNHRSIEYCPMKAEFLKSN